MGWNKLPCGPVEDVFRQDLYQWTGTQVIANNAWLNFFSLAGITKLEGGTIGTVLSNSSVKFPPVKGWSQVIFSVRISGTIGGVSGQVREWLTQLRRAGGVVVIGSDNDVKVSGDDISNRDTALISWTYNETDPFSINGAQVGILNVSSQVLTLTSVAVRIQRIVNS